MRKKSLVAAVIITALVGIGAFSYSASASSGWWGSQNRTEWREKMQEIFQNKDYDAWKNMENERHQERLNWMTQERFDKMAEMRQLMEDGKYDEAKKIREELGMPMKGRWGDGNDKPFRDGNGPCDGDCRRN